jgi:hypothetical protein
LIIAKDRIVLRLRVCDWRDKPGLLRSFEENIEYRISNVEYRRKYQIQTRNPPPEAFVGRCKEFRITRGE